MINLEKNKINVRQGKGLQDQEEQQENWTQKKNMTKKKKKNMMTLQGKINDDHHKRTTTTMSLRGKGKVENKKIRQSWRWKQWSKLIEDEKRTMRIRIIKNRRQKDDHEFHQRDEHVKGNFEQRDKGDD